MLHSQGTRTEDMKIVGSLQKLKRITPKSEIKSPKRGQKPTLISVFGVVGAFFEVVLFQFLETILDIARYRGFHLGLEIPETKG